ncbi:MAG: FAD-dependent oxidoreductase [Thermofilaceae archaeon]
MGDVAVVGAGVAGLLLALNLRSNVVVFESGRPGLRGGRCPGIVSADTLAKLPEGWKFVEQAYDSMELAVPELALRVSITSRGVFAYKIDRRAHEERLAELLEARGVELRERTRVYRAEPLRDCVRLRWCGGERVYDAAVIAEGYPPILARQCNLSPHVEERLGVHASARATGVSSSTLYVVYSPKLLGGFAWMAPVDEKRCSLGVVAGRREAWGLLRRAAVLLRKQAGVEAELEGGLRGGYVLRGYPRALGRGRLFVFGDAAATVKSLSGGGLYAIAALAGPLASVVDSIAVGGEPERSALKRIEGVLAALRRSYILAERVDRTIAASPRLGLKLEVEVQKLEYDDHAAALAQILTNVRRLARATAAR